MIKSKKEDYSKKLDVEDYSKINLSIFTIIKKSKSYYITVADWYLDKKLKIHKDIEYGGIWKSRKEAHKFLINTFMN